MRSPGSTEIQVIFLYVTDKLITEVIFILRSLSISLKLWSVNHFSIYGNSELKTLRNIKHFGEIYDNRPDDLLGKTHSRLWNHVDNHNTATLQ